MTTLVSVSSKCQNKIYKNSNNNQYKVSHSTIDIKNKLPDCVITHILELGTRDLIKNHL